MSVTFDIPRVTTAPVVEPVSIGEAKAHLRIDHGDEDAYIGHLVTVAREFVETDAQISIMPQTVTVYLDDFSGPSIDLRRPPVSAVSGITYYDSAGAQQTLATTVYETDLVSVPPAVCLKDGQTWPTVDDRQNAVAITCTAGYSSPALVPAIVKQAILVLVEYWFRNRSALMAMNDDIERSYTALLSRVRWSRYA